MSKICSINVPSSASSVSTPTPFEYGEDYAFYDARSGLKPDYYQKILATATTSIQIWDTHFRPDEDWKVFKKVKSPNLRITILTICDEKYYSIDDVKKMANKIINQLDSAVLTSTLTIFAFHDKCRRQKIMWHDRFLVIDDAKFFLIGPSLNNQVGSNTSFGIHYLSKSKDIDLLKRKLHSFFSQTGNASLRHKITRRRP